MIGKIEDYEILKRIFCGIGMKSVGIIKVQHKETKDVYYVVGISISELGLDYDTRNVISSGKWFEEKKFKELL